MGARGVPSMTSSMSIRCSASLIFIASSAARAMSARFWMKSSSVWFCAASLKYELMNGSSVWLTSRWIREKRCIT